MAAHCAHAGPTSRHTRQSRLPDRKAARRRRGLDGRGAVVTRITAALMLGFIGLYYGPRYDLSLVWHLQCVGCDKKILWPSVGLSLGLIGTCWYSLASLVCVSFWRERPSKLASWAETFCAGVNISRFERFCRSFGVKAPLLSSDGAGALHRGFFKILCRVGRLRVAMSLIAALSGSRGHSSPAPAPYRTALQKHDWPRHPFAKK
jgi:hypothetical protein